MADFPPAPTRKYYGISWMDENCNIVYKVATNIIDSSEFKTPGYEEYIIPSGNYLTETIRDWMQQLPKIKETFGTMMTDPGFDSSAACVEWYIDDEKMICMARLVEDKEKMKK